MDFTTVQEIRTLSHYYFSNTVVSLISGFAVYMMLGFLQSSGTSKDNYDYYTESGPGLVFVAYPTGKYTLIIFKF